MNNLDQCWNRLIALAHRGAMAAVPAAAPLGFATRTVALWRAEGGNIPVHVGWTSFAVPGFAAAALVAMLAVITLGPAVGEISQTRELVALADSLVSDSMLP